MDLSNTYAVEAILLIDETDKHGEEVEELRRNDDDGDDDDDDDDKVDETEKHGEEMEDLRRNDDDGDDGDKVDETENHDEEMEELRRNDDDDKEVVSKGNFVDAENVHGNKITTSCNSSFPAIRARISDDIDEEDDEAKEEDDWEDGIEEENKDMREFASIESYDDASILASSPGMESRVVGSFFGLVPFPGASIDAQRSALRKLNELSSGVPSVDVSILENVSEEEFRHRVMDTAISKGFSLDDEILLEILDALVPVVRERINRNKDGSYRGTIIPVAKPTIEDDDEDDDYITAAYGAEAYGIEGEKVNGKADLNLVELPNLEILSCSALGLRIRCPEYESDEQEDSTLPLMNGEENNLSSAVGSEPKKPDNLDVIRDEVLI